MEDSILITSESTPPSSPSGYAPINKVSDLCAAGSPVPSSPLIDSGYQDLAESEPLVGCVIGGGRPFEETVVSLKHTAVYRRKSERLKFHFLSDSEDEQVKNAEVLSRSDDSDVEVLSGDNGLDVEVLSLKSELKEDGAWQVEEKFEDANSEQKYNFHFISDSEDEEVPGKNCDFKQGISREGPQNSRKTLSQEDNPRKRPTLSKEERKMLKEMKDKKKADKAALLEKYRQMKPGECLKRITINLDKNLLESDIVVKALEAIKLLGDVKYDIIEQKEPNCVTWKTRMPGSDGNHEVPESFALFIWSSERILTSIKYCTLVDTFTGLQSKYPGFKLSLAICGLNNYYRKIHKLQRPGKISLQEQKNEGKKKARKRKSDEMNLSRDQIEMALTELEIVLGMSNRIINHHEDLALYIYQFTKAIAETPYRKEIQKRDNERTWYARGDSRDCVRIDRDLNGLTTLWIQQLSQFNKASLDAAKAIVQIYPTPRCLYEAYQKCSSEKEMELLLQNIEVKRSVGCQTLSRKLGPDLSRKICLMFTKSDGDILLSQ